MVLELSTVESQQTDSRLAGRIACITGASSGLGRATALRFAASGARVVCADLKQASEATDKEIRDKFGDDRAIFVECDVTDEEQIKNMIQKTVEWGDRLDIICNYAGIAFEAANWGTPQRVHETDTSVFDKTMMVNARGVWLCCKYAIKQMMEQEPLPPNARGEKTRGWVINAASMLGLIGVGGASAYTTSKHAVVGMTKQMAIDYGQDRIHCNALAPGFVKSPMIEQIIAKQQDADDLASRHPWNSLGRPEDIADAALFLASDEAAWITGHTLVIDGAYTCQ